MKATKTGVSLPILIIYMESLENLTIEEQQQLLKEKGQEIADIFAKLSEAGAADEIPDDFMDRLVW